ncbi:MAG: hypothetical protein GX633_04665 [Clostridiales bacterium]|nr:hypothetical protein [Clostridiales bacterium]
MDRYFTVKGLPGAFVLTCIMSFFAFLLAIIIRTPDRWLCFAAMVFSSMGDVVLMNFKGIVNGIKFPSFYIGAALFIVAHILYSVAFGTMIKSSGHTFFNTGVVLGILLFLSSFVYFLVMYKKSKGVPHATLVMVVVYLLVISTLCTIVFSHAFSSGGIGIISALGALSFFVSDFFIGLGILNTPNAPKLGELIWWFYPIGQILLLIGG